MNWPQQSYANMVKFYGNVGDNQTQIVVPYPMRLAWDLNAKVSKLTCHEKVADSLKKIFSDTLDAYGIDKIKKLKLDLFSGCLNVRKMRGGSSWSIHSWGAAIDLDDEENQLKWGKERAQFGKPDYIKFWQIVESEGWVSLGRSRNYDFMHFQAAKL